MAKSDPSLDNVISLPDGRTLGYAVYGIPFPRLSPLPEGPPLPIRTVRFCDSLPPPARHEDYASGIADVPTIIYCHGTPGSRLEASPLHKHALAVGARIISIDRPGIGLSSPLPRRTVLGFTTDVKELLKQLKVYKFYVLAYSAGAPYAFGLAHVFGRNQPEEGGDGCSFKGVGIVAGLAPWSIIVENITLTERILANITYWCPSLVGYLLEKEVVRFARQSVRNVEEDSYSDGYSKTSNRFDKLM